MSTNPFVGASVANRYAVARPALHRHAIALMAGRVPTVRRAIDIGCGTGLSTLPLAAMARIVVGVDASADMIRRAEKRQGVSFVLSLAERLPFPDAAFGLATIASAIHWFDDAALREARRIVEDGGGLFIYDVWFPAEMAGAPAFNEWLRDVSEARYPAVRKHPRPDFEVMGFERRWDEDLRRDVSMSLDELVDYLMTHSERIAAVRSGLESEEEQWRFLRNGIAMFFDDAPRRTLRFGIRAEMFSAG